MSSRYTCVCILFCLWEWTSAQPVVFINQTDKLNQVAGFTQYSDCAVDMNGDGLDDVVRIGNKGMYIDYQQKNGVFSQRFFSLPIVSPPSWSICAGDIDNNGYNDLLFGHTTSVSFVRANDKGNNYQEKVMPSFIFSQRSTFADIDNDGWLDAFVCNDTAQSIPYKNMGEGEMIMDTNLIHTADRPGSYAAIWTDFDNDGDSDLYITKCQAGAPPGAINRTNLLYRNNGDGTYTEVGAEAGLDDNAQSWSTVFEDFDNDGDFDAFIVNHDFQNRLFRNNGDGTFTDVFNGSGIEGIDLNTFENASGDFNNDGFIDIFSDLQNELYTGHGDLTFTGQDVPVKPGAVADLNDDGFLDVFHAGQLWINQGNQYHWLKVFPIGIVGNRNGIGARVEAYGTWGMQVREVRSGQSYSPMSSLTIHFGLGMNDRIDSLIVRWPSGVVSIMRELDADSTYLMPEATCFAPTTEMTVIGNTTICAGDTTILIAPVGYARYIWSDQSAAQIRKVVDEGDYYAICLDSSGCVSLTSTVEIKKIADTPPFIFTPEGSRLCENDSLVLYASSGENSIWSNGVSGSSGITVHEGGLYTVSTDALCADDTLTSIPFAVEVLPSTPPVADDAVFVQGDSVLLVAEGENCQWYDQPSGGNLLATGCAFQTMPLTSSVTYYVESHYLNPGEIQSGGKMDTSGNGGLAGQAGYLLFETWKPFTLDSVTAYVPSGGPLGTRFVQLWSGDSLLAFKRFELHPGENVFDLNFYVPVGKYSLQCQQGNLWRNTGPLEYPYPIGDAGQITSSSFGDGYYFFFYDWKIKTQDIECISERIAVEVILSSSEVISNQEEFSIFPNPVTGQLTIEAKWREGEVKTLRLVDVSGREIMRKVLGYGHLFHLDFNPFPPGVYSLQVFGKYFSETKLVVKK